jgi:hypothetical protein
MRGSLTTRSLKSIGIGYCIACCASCARWKVQFTRADIIDKTPGFGCGPAGAPVIATHNSRPAKIEAVVAGESWLGRLLARNYKEE